MIPAERGKRGGAPTITVWVAQLPRMGGKVWSEQRIREELARILEVPIENVRAGLGDVVTCEACGGFGVQGVLDVELKCEECEGRGHVAA